MGPEPAVYERQIQQLCTEGQGWRERMQSSGARKLKEPTIIDVEASGFGRGSYPIEIGVALPDRTSHCFLIAREPDWTAWDLEAEALHGISREALEEHGRPARVVALRLNELLSGHVVYSDAWGFDVSWLGKLFDAVDLPQGFRLAAISELFDGIHYERWSATKARVVEELDLRRHRASGDARILQETLRRLRAEIDEG
jgi:hypothetical protein